MLVPVSTVAMVVVVVVVVGVVVVVAVVVVAAADMWNDLLNDRLAAFVRVFMSPCPIFTVMPLC